MSSRFSTGEMARRWGAVRRFQEDGEVVEVACFPSPEALAARAEAELRECALGYRCRYIIDTARRVAGGAIDTKALRGGRYGDALAALLRLPGIGRKVADCILLFALVASARAQTVTLNTDSTSTSSATTSGNGYGKGGKPKPKPTPSPPMDICTSSSCSVMPRRSRWRWK